MTIQHIGSGHLFAVPFDLAAYENADHGWTWGEVQEQVFLESAAGQWLTSNNVEYRFFEQIKRLNHGEVMIFIPDANEAMRFKLAHVGV